MSFKNGYDEMPIIDEREAAKVMPKNKRDWLAVFVAWGIIIFILAFWAGFIWVCVWASRYCLR